MGSRVRLNLGTRPRYAARDARTESVLRDHHSHVHKLGAPHHEAHFHAYYQEATGVFSLEPIELVAGDLPQRQRRLIEAWAELHQDELLADWRLLQAGQRPRPVAPLA